jgi:hypothetical protein
LVHKRHSMRTSMMKPQDANRIQWANGITRQKGLQVLFTKKKLSYEWILEQCFWQLIIINAYNGPSIWYVFFPSILNKYENF